MKEMENNKTIAISEATIEKLMMYYIEDRNAIIKMKNENSPKYLEEDDVYNYHLGCCETAEKWFAIIGISTNCDFIQKRLLRTEGLA